MDHNFSVILPHAIAVAVSPMPIAALILILLSNRAKVNSIFYGFGWTLGIIANIFLFAFLFTTQATGQKETSATFVQTMLGGFLLFLAYRQWTTRPRKGEIAIMPSWMKIVESISPIMSFIIAFMLVTINAKNTVIDMAAGVVIGSLATSSGQVTATIVYTAIASSTIVIPVITFLILGKKLNPTLNKTKAWLVKNNAIILFVIFLIMGVNLLYKAILG